jgi:hypothetical protein
LQHKSADDKANQNVWVIHYAFFLWNKQHKNHFKQKLFDTSSLI